MAYYIRQQIDCDNCSACIGTFDADDDLPDSLVCLACGAKTFITAPSTNLDHEQSGQPEKEG